MINPQHIIVFASFKKVDTFCDVCNDGLRNIIKKTCLVHLFFLASARPLHLWVFYVVDSCDFFVKTFHIKSL
jgi:hypothetical protein